MTSVTDSAGDNTAADEEALLTSITNEVHLAGSNVAIEMLLPQRCMGRISRLNSIT